METTPFELKDYETLDGKCPYQEWYSELLKKEGLLPNVWVI